MFRFGRETLTEMYDLRKKIKAQREQTIYAQKRRRRNLIDGIFVAIALAFAGSLVYWVVDLIMQYR